MRILEAWQTPTESLLAPLQLPKAYKGADGTKSGAQFLFQVIKSIDCINRKKSQLNNPIIQCQYIGTAIEPQIELAQPSKEGNLK